MYAVPIFLEKFRFVCVPLAGGLTASHLTQRTQRSDGSRCNNKNTNTKKKNEKQNTKKRLFKTAHISSRFLDVALYRIILNVPCQEEHDLNFSSFFSFSSFFFCLICRERCRNVVVVVGHIYFFSSFFLHIAFQVNIWQFAVDQVERKWRETEEKKMV